MDSRTFSSRLRELVKFLSTVKGDLANVTGPPSLLAPLSVVEVGRYWAERPSVLAAPAREPNPEKRALLVLRWFLIALRGQLYVGVDLNNNNNNGNKTTTSTSIRKPLNAFLGELFLASWTDEETKGTIRTTTRLVAEQVSHHPPITAMHVSCDDDGGGLVRADGYARVEMAFGGVGAGLQIRQVGHATVRVDRYGEDYLIPLPDVRVRGFLAGCLYPEIAGVYHIVGSNGFRVEMKFWGEGFIRGKRNAFEARVYRDEEEGEGEEEEEEGEEDGEGENKENNSDKKKKKKKEKKRSRVVYYEVAGCWSEGWTVKDGRTGELVEVYRADAPENGPARMEMEPVEKQDPWESRRAWAGVLRGLAAGDMRSVVAEKTKIEQAQRQMRASEAARGVVWEPLFFNSYPSDDHPVFHRLSHGLGWQLHADKTKGVWKLDDGRLKRIQRPFRGDITPFGY
ncbi:uncharacterized protein P884DRAFT_200478 [Thermothelomyces heterothallicus CBS 202.75]|uniref:uncharacterized protein n=1 Tax=Thermothelomyces heterothallicus CBS 202.75 TaxID=1149848 RepID=UPI003742AF2D